MKQIIFQHHFFTMNRKEKLASLNKRIDKSLAINKIPHFIPLQKVAERASLYGLLPILIEIKNRQSKNQSVRRTRKSKKVDFTFHVAMNAVNNQHGHVVVWILKYFPSTYKIISKFCVLYTNQSVLETIYSSSIDLFTLQTFHYITLNHIKSFRKLTMLQLVLVLFFLHESNPNYQKYLTFPYKVRLHAQLMEDCLENNYSLGMHCLDLYYFRRLPEESVPVYLILLNHFMFTKKEAWTLRIKKRLWGIELYIFKYQLFFR